MYDFNEIINRHNTLSAKYDDWDLFYNVNEKDDVIHMGVADMDFKSPPEIIAAMRKVVDYGIFGYTNLPKDYPLWLKNYMKRRHNTDIDEKWITFSPRINMAFNILVQILTDEKDAIILHTPAYPQLKMAITNYNRELIDIPLSYKDKGKENGFYMDIGLLSEKVKEYRAKGFKVRTLILCNPHNPTGRVWTRAELDELTDFCLKEEIIILSDEIHEDFIRDGHSFTSILSYSQKLNNRLVVCNSLTKTFNIMGCIMANVIIPDENIRGKFREALDIMGWHNPNIFAANILESAYNSCDKWLDEVNIYIEENQRLTMSFFEKKLPKIKVINAEGTFILWLDVSKLNTSTNELLELLVKKGRVSLYGGDKYGEQGSKYLRMIIALPRVRLEKALNGIYEALKDLCS